MEGIREVDKRRKRPAAGDVRGVAGLDEARAWLTARGIEDVECVTPDQAGVGRGKVMPIGRFLDGSAVTLPVSVFAQTITGEYPEDDAEFHNNPTDSDIMLRPDCSTLTVVPWASKPTAQILHDAFTFDGQPVEIAPRQVLRRIVDLYERRGWKPVVAPEIEFYLVKPDADPDHPLEPPIGRSGRPEPGRQSFSILALSEFEAFFDDMYKFAEAQGLEIDTLVHEDGLVQMEVNLRHGDPIMLADQAFLLKRTIREAALRSKMYATFMAKPIADEPGSAMHIHQSIVDAETGRNIFSGPDGEPTSDFFAFIAGHQRYLPAVMCMLAPYVNSYRRLVRRTTSPINVHWGYDNRTVGIRVPNSGPEARRVENRVPSSDANPYLAIAASLATGYLGIEQALTPEDPVGGSAVDLPFGLPRALPDAIALFQETEELAEILGRAFAATYRAVKLTEYETFARVISSWERKHLLLNV